MLTATILALSAALCHAAWNLILKLGGDRDASSLAVWLIGGIVALPVLWVVGPPEAASLPFLAAGALVQVLYAYGLARAYGEADFSLAYPIARGLGSLLVALGGTLLFADQLGPIAWAGIGVVALSLVMLVRRGTTFASIRWAVFTGIVICGYQLFDAAGTRRAGSGFAYGLAVAVAVGFTITVTGLIRGKGPALIVELRRFGPRLAAAGVLMTTSYTMVVIAFQHAAVGYVSVLREASVLIGALLGWLFLREAFGRYRLASALVMLGGMGLLIAGG